MSKSAKNIKLANPRISLSDPVIGEAEKKALCDVIDSQCLTMGDRVKEFESAFVGLHGMQDAVAVNSCTAGLHLCLKGLNVGPGDEVLVPSLTFVATVNAVLYAGATPVFVDIQHLDLPHISLDDALTKCTDRTKAIIVMHYGGYLADLNAWRTFSDEHGLSLIEDAAHASGLEGVGRLSDASAFSFFTNKNMTTAEGGMVLARELKVLERIRSMRSHGMTTGTLDRHRGHAFSYDVNMLGYNYRLDEMRAAIGLVQLSKLEKWNNLRKELTDSYRRLIAEQIPAIKVLFTTEHKTAAHIMPVLLPEEADRHKVMDQLRQSGIQSSIHYPPAHQFSYYRKRFTGVSLPNTEHFCDRELTLPLHPGLTGSGVDRVVRTLKHALGN